MELARAVMLVTTFDRSHDRDVLNGLSQFARSQGWRLLIENPACSELAERIRRGGVGGIIASTDAHEVCRRLSFAEMPIVDVWCDTSPFAKVRIDDRAAGKLAAEHLLDRGFRRVAFCGMFQSPFEMDRYDGFRTVVEARGLPCLTHWVDPSRAHDYSPESCGIEARRLREWLAELPRPIGIMAANDHRAMEVVNICRELGLAVPDEMAVVGVDNEQRSCEMAAKPISSVAPDGMRTGVLAAELLGRMMNGEAPPREPVRVPPLKVIVRESSNAYPMQDEVAAVLRFIETHYTQEISAEALLETAGLSRRALEIRFRNAVGRSPFEEIRRRRMLLAEELLSTTEMQIGEVARRCGISEVKTFHPLFRRHTGMSPGDYRRRSRAGVRVNAVDRWAGQG